MTVCTSIILNYESEDSTRNICRNIRENNADFLRIVVVDNSSDSDLRNWCSEKGVHYVNSGGNVGYAAGHNLGIKRYIDDTDYFLLLNPDVMEIDSSKITGLMKSAQKYDLDIISPIVLDHQKEPAYNLPTLKGKIYRGIGILPKLREKSGSRPFILSDHVPGCAIMIKKDVLMDIGLLNEKFFLYCEEEEFCYRARLGNYDIGIDRSIQVIHQDDSSGIRHSDQHQSYYRNRNIFLLSQTFSGARKKMFLAIELFLLAHRTLGLVIELNTGSVKSTLAGIFDGIRGRFGRHRY